MSNKLLLGLLLTILLFVTVVLGTARFYAKEGKVILDVATPPGVPEAPAPPAVE